MGVCIEFVPQSLEDCVDQRVRDDPLGRGERIRFDARFAVLVDDRGHLLRIQVEQVDDVAVANGRLVLTVVDLFQGGEVRVVPVSHRRRDTAP